MAFRFLSHACALLAGLVLLLGSILLAGCDVESPTQDDPLFTVTNDLEKRIRLFESENAQITPGASAAGTAGEEGTPTVSLKAVSRIDPPSADFSAGHLSVSGGEGSGQVFVGYKIPGPDFGGGIDILDKSTPTQLVSGDNALRSDNLDVQEVAFDKSGSAPNNLYIAGAVDPQVQTFANTPAAAIRVQIDNRGKAVTDGAGDVKAAVASMTDNLAKGLTLAPIQDQDHTIYAVTDESAFFEFDEDLDSKNELTVSGAEFNSVDAFRGGTAALTRTQGGRIFEILTTGKSAGTVRGRTPGLRTGAEGTIGRAEAHDHSGGGNPKVTARLYYVALNEGGLAVLNERGTTTLFEKTDKHYVSVTAADYDGGFSRVYAVGGAGTLDVFEVTDEIDDGTPSTGLELLRSFELRELLAGNGGYPLRPANAETTSGASDRRADTESTVPDPVQINDILAEGRFLYVAASEKGTVVVEAANVTTQSPNAAFTANPTTGTGPLTVDFDASASFDPDGQIQSYHWEFGDGSTGTGATVTHTYSRAKIFTVTLTVTDDAGATSSTTKTITVPSTVCDAVVSGGSRIQAAVDNASGGDVVCVEPGTYVEDVSVDNAITLRGSTNPEGAHPAVIDGRLTVEAAGASLTHLKVAPTTTFSVGTGIDPVAIRATASNVTIEENLVDGISGDATGPGGSGTVHGIQVWHPGPTFISGVTIRGNTVRGVETLGDAAAGWPNYGGAVGIKVQGVVKDVQVLGNTVRDVHSAGWVYGVTLTHTGNDPQARSPENVTIEKNTLEKLNDGTRYNVFMNPNAAPYPGAAVAIDDTENPSGPGGANADQATVRLNNFLSAPIGAQNKDQVHTLVADCNYWGHESGPSNAPNPANKGAEAVGDVDFTPWSLQKLGPGTPSSTTCTGGP